ncbi:MFS transporter [Actinomadura sp. DC4]|uniref:MFS transporter n=1 Tax=Actinomadura sp. DC4 TaxID=3055069 RepID=UPI0025B17A47|nr:MFS transporter [Actinomadura sp. DC4]MDN3357423.1 MFS transporter [Actinomadura sp. DC4]
MSQPVVQGTPPETANQRHRRGHGNPWLTLIAVALGVIMVTLDGTVVAIANPAISKDLGASLSDLQWVTNGYLLALAVSLITAGKLGDRIGHKPVFLIGAVGFGLASAGIGLSRDIGLMIALRVAQGLFGAMLQPTALALLRAAFPARRLNMAIGIWSACIAASTAAGPIVGGLLVQHVNWESVFFINVPVGLVALVVGALFLGDTRGEDRPASFDLLGVMLLSGMLFSLVWAVIKAPAYGWGDGRTLAFFGAAIALLAVFLLRESRTREPLLPLGLFRSVPLSVGVVLMTLMAFGMLGGMFFLTFYLQSVHLLTPVQTGVRLLPMMLAMMVASPVAGALISKIGPRPPLFAGMALGGVAFVGLSTLGIDASFTAMFPWFTLLGIGLSPVLVAATDIIVGNAPVALAGVAGGLQQVSMQVGGALGTSVLGAVMTAKVAGVLPGHMKAGGLPVPTGPQVDAMKGAISQGIAPVPPHTPPRVAQALVRAGDLSFIDGMHLAFEVSAGIMFGAALLSLLVRAGRQVEGAATLA